MQEIKSLSVIDGKSLLALDVEPPRFIVDRLIPVGLHILSGSAKIGKSWLGSVALPTGVHRGKSVGV